MPVHDWSRVDAAVFCDFRHSLLASLANVLNRSALPENYYALITPGLTLEPDPLRSIIAEADEAAGGGRGTSRLIEAPPRAALVGETDIVFWRQKKNLITVHESGNDRVVAVCDVVLPWNKSSRAVMRSFGEKAVTLLCKGIHLLVIDLLPPGPHDPSGVHGIVWNEVSEQEPCRLPAQGSVTLAAYESSITLRAYVEHPKVGDPLPEMPLFVAPVKHVAVPLESAYEDAWQAVPRRWRSVLE